MIPSHVGGLFKFFGDIWTFDCFGQENKNNNNDDNNNNNNNNNVTLMTFSAFF